MLLHGMHVKEWRHLARSESGVFGSLMSKSHSSNSFTGPVLGSVVLANLSPLELDRSQLQVPGKCMPPVAIVTHTSEVLSVQGWLRSQILKKGFVSEGRLQQNF